MLIRGCFYMVVRPMTYEGPKSKPKPIQITRPGQTEVERIRNQYYPDYYSSILGASMQTGINRNTLTQAVETGQPIKKGKGKGCTVKYRDPEDENKRLKQYENFKSQKQLAALGLASITEAVSELERLQTIERHCSELQKQHTALIIENTRLKGLLNLERGQ